MYGDVMSEMKCRGTSSGPPLWLETGYSPHPLSLKIKLRHPFSLRINTY
jgi:hypothetical protein